MKKFIDLGSLGSAAPAIMNLSFVQYIVTSGKVVLVGFIDGSQKGYTSRGCSVKFAEKIICKWIALEGERVFVITELGLGIGALKMSRIVSILFKKRTAFAVPQIEIWFDSGQLGLRDPKDSMSDEQVNERANTIFKLFMENT